MKLPDMCALEFVELVEKETRLPVVMICDTYDESAMLRFLLNGAMFCLTKPVHLHDVKKLWQHGIVKAREVMLESVGLLAVNVLKKESCKSSAMSTMKTVPPLHELGVSSQGHRKKKMEEIANVEGSSMELPLSLARTPYVLEIVKQLGCNSAVLPEALHFINAPGHSTRLVTERLQQDHKCFEEGQKPQSSESSDSQLPSVIVDWSLDLGIYTNNGSASNLGHHSQFMEIVQHPHFRDQLKKTVNAALLKWLTDLGGYVNPTMIWRILNFDQEQGYPHQTSSNALLGVAPPLGPTDWSRTTQSSPALVPVNPTNAANGFMESSSTVSVAESPAESALMLLARAAVSEMQVGEADGPPFPDDDLESFSDCDSN